MDVSETSSQSDFCVTVVQPQQGKPQFTFRQYVDVGDSKRKIQSAEFRFSTSGDERGRKISFSEHLQYEDIKHADFDPVDVKFKLQRAKAGNPPAKEHVFYPAGTIRDPGSNAIVRKPDGANVYLSVEDDGDNLNVERVEERDDQFTFQSKSSGKFITYLHWKNRILLCWQPATHPLKNHQWEVYEDCSHKHFIRSASEKHLYMDIEKKGQTQLGIHNVLADADNHKKDYNFTKNINLELNVEE